MTEFSQFLLKNRKINFYDFYNKESRFVDIKYTINIKSVNNIHMNAGDKLFDYLNNSKTLISKISSAYLVDPLDKRNSNCIIFMKTILAPTRENIDDIICMID